MKNGKKPTVAQKKVIKKIGLDPENWLIYKNLPEELHLVHRYTNTKKVIPAF
ncbi:DUF6906 family protein [Fictibacillus fluitans]|uniref:DUF6906 domain-containing protein n=1 Tax=Fictibacillus fluitans TaxID=3058422 RepID=A0ABT8HX90_9BACL|nr:hypothetical protein [Fictibacillus sp. NE201]MDN4525353.1 hypothetical protein [Fictibacillus sp. NE201]